MTINSIGQGTYAYGLQQKQQNISNMFAALKSGDMASAQKAYVSSGMPPMATHNTSPLGRLYQALRSEDLAGAQKAALDMQGIHSKSTKTNADAAVSASRGKATPTQKTVIAIAEARIKAQQTNFLSMMERGNNVNIWS